jgi:predicted RNase H-like HicB family nuclease
LHPKTLASILKQAGNRAAMSERRYLIVVEGDSSTNFSAYSPDIPGVGATGATRNRCEREMRKAIELHLEGLAEDGEPAPEAKSSAGYAVVNVA